jgi:DNA-binding winged helix-turn-helix (wHTH) protein
MHAQRREQRVTFGPFCLDLRSGTLAKDGTRLRIPDQSVKVLIALLETPGTTVSRDELRAKLWPHGTHVEFDQSLNSAVRRLRTALCDTAISPKYVVTQPKRGYRFVHPVQTLDGEFGNTMSPVAAQEVSLEAPVDPATDTLRKLRLSVKVRILLLLLIPALLIPALRLARGRYWAYKEAIPRAGVLAETGEWSAAFQLALEAAARLPADDKDLQTLWPKVSREISIVSEPAGAEVFWRPYA